jgi:hypothetical protein
MKTTEPLPGPRWVKSAVKAVLPGTAVTWIGDKIVQRQDKKLFLDHLRPSDVFLVGHPKSGNTWLAYMLSVLLERVVRKKATLANVKEFVPAVHFRARDSEISLYSHLPTPRIFRNEGPVYPELYPKTIYLVRDPRAVMVSYYHHCLHDTKDPDWKLRDFVREMLENGCIRSLEPYLVRWDRQVCYWLERLRHQPVLLVKYEAMIQDRRKVLDRVINFIGLKCDPEDVASAVERGSFDNMRRDEERHGAEPYSGTKGEGGYYTRRGKTDAWREELPDDLAEWIEREFSHAMKKVGYLSRGSMTFDNPQAESHMETLCTRNDANGH